MKKKKVNKIDQVSNWFTHSIGTNASILIHTFFFVGIFALSFFGVGIDKILLILTTAVSLEAIYLAIFIQMSVNKTTKSLASVEEDIDEIQEDVDDIQEDVEDIQEDVDDIQEDVDHLETNIKDISEDYIDDEVEENDTVKILTSIEAQLNLLKEEIAELKKKAS